MRLKQCYLLISFIHSRENSMGLVFEYTRIFLDNIIFGTSSFIKCLI